jgi:hydroxymethylbilane synthase
VLEIWAAWGDPDGQQPLVHAQDKASVTDTGSAVRLGESVARQLQAAVQAASAKA